MITALLILLTSPQDAAFSSALDKLGATDGVTITFVDRTVSGVSRTWTLKAQKPNLLSAVSETHTITADGSSLVVYERSTNSYTKEDQTVAALAELLERAELLPARLFLDPKGKWLKTAKSAGTRKRRGVDLTGTLLTPKKDQSATLYFGTTDKVINYFQIETQIKGQKEIRILDRFKVVGKSLDSAEFVFSPAAGAKDVTALSGAESGLNERIQKDISEGLIAYRQLTWDDFKIVASGSGGTLAFTASYTRNDYDWKFTRASGGWKATLTRFELRSGLDTTLTWRLQSLKRVDMDRLLPHEQGHLDIAEIQARKIRQIKLSDMPTGLGATKAAAGADAARKIRKLLADASAIVSAQNILYDKETNRSNNAAAQRQWEAKLAREMKGD